MERGILACLVLASHSLPDQIIFDVFEYGGSYKHLNSPMRFLPPSSQVTEVCEGESFMLQCPSSTVIELGTEGDIQFGRGGPWEGHTMCGHQGDNITECGTVDARKQVLQMCPGQRVCGVHLNGMFRGRDPCPGPEENYSSRIPVSRPRKYLTVRFSCVDVNKSNIGPNSETTERSRRNHINKVVSSTQQPAIETMEEEFYEKLDSITEINEDVKEYVTHFLEDAYSNIKFAARFGEVGNRSSVLGLTERVGARMMGLLNNEDKEVAEFELETSEVSLKLVKKKYQENSETKWRKSGAKIVLPDQQELMAQKREKQEESLEITMASYNNLQEELESASDVITVSVNKHVNLSKPVTFLLPNNGTSNVSCAFWSFSQDQWSTFGCSTVCHNGTHTKCSCTHLTNFALIFNVHEEFVGELDWHGDHLETITYVGFTISIFCMLLTVLVFLTTRGSNSSERDVIHINLCISLLTAEVIFMFGISETSDPIVCSLIAALLHYFFLASFAWMFLEGFQIYKMLFKVFDTSSASSRLKNFVIGYLVPLLIVILSFSIDALLRAGSLGKEEEEDLMMCSAPSSEWSSYGTRDYCWLRLDNQFILAFIVPAVTVIASNIGFLLFAFHSMLAHKFKPASHSSQELVVAYMKGVGVLMALLGSTWIFGILFLAINSLFLAYAFTVLNSLQGVGIFVFQCLLNPAVRSVARRRAAPLLAALGLGSQRGEYRTTEVEVESRQSVPLSIAHSIPSS